MSREVKFRVWNKVEKRYRRIVRLNYDDGELVSITVYGPDDFAPTILPLERVILEQSTGLKDKNGKEIYEGDIVEGDMGVFEVKWYDLVAQFMFRPNMSMKYHPPFTSTQLEVMKVIGNIHENPELLGGEE